MNYTKPFKLVLLVTGLFSSQLSEAGTEPKLNLDPMVVVARSEKPLSLLPYTVNTVDTNNITAQSIFRSTPEALKDIPGIMIQKTGYGQGSPYIRGFTGFRTVFLIDGIRLNNSTFRDGPNQYWNTVDPYSINQLEVIKGSSSALYGSDAIGGTVNAITRSNTNFEPGFNITPRFSYRYANAENSNTGHIELSGNYNDSIGVHLGLSYKDFGDLEGGNSIDTQNKTGYQEQDLHFKAEYFFSKDSKISFAHQRVDLDDAWRTHKTVHGISWHGTTVGSEKKRVLDQNRELTYLQYEGKNLDSFIDGLKLSLSYQKQDEQRFRIKRNNQSDHQGFSVETFGFSLQTNVITQFGKWTFGVENYHDEVDSFAKKYNADGSFRSKEIQGPVANDASYNLLDFFIQHEFSPHNDIDIILGSRYTYAAAHANKLKDPVTGNQISFTDNWNGLVGSARILFHLDEADHYKIFTGVSQGFRAPNLSDLTRLDSARSNEIETAALNLDSEDFISYEIGTKINYENAAVQLSYFYTDISGMIVRAPTGNIIDGENEVTKKNAGNGFIHGIEFNGSYNFHPQWTATASATWLEGHVETFPTSAAIKKTEPIDRMMPPSANFGLQWDSLNRDFWLKADVTLVENQNRLSTRDKSDTQRIPPGGTPGYVIYNLNAGWKFNKNVDLFLALENIGDKDYRVHGSGLNGAGRNFIASIDIHF